MDPMTDVVIRSGGSIIDYQGDGLAAMWNAPFEQKDHQTLACRAALEIQDFFCKSRNTPMESIVRQLKVGVGLHCGAAFVGNAGSQRRLKYGPSGPAVNLTSRLESSTKYFGVPIIISGDVREHLSPEEFATRKLCQARLPGFRQPVELYELHCPLEEPSEEQQWRAARDAYEQALQCFEQRDFPRVAECLAAIPTDWLNRDAAAVWLQENATRCCQETPQDFEPVLTIARK
jgi:adenylate cyclase